MRSPCFSSVMVLIASLGLTMATGCNAKSNTAPSSNNGPDLPNHNPSTAQLTPPPTLDAGSGVRVVATHSTPSPNGVLMAGKNAYVEVDVEGTCYCTVHLKVGSARSASATMGPEVSHASPFDSSYTPVTLNGAPVRGVRLGTIAQGALVPIDYIWIGAWVTPGSGVEARIQGTPPPNAQFTFPVNWRAQ